MAGNVYPLGGGGGGGTTITEAQVRSWIAEDSNQHWGEVPTPTDLVTLTDAEQGDTARATDTGERFRLVGTDPTDLADWELDSATDDFWTTDNFWI